MRVGSSTDLPALSRAVNAVWSEEPSGKPNWPLHVAGMVPSKYLLIMLPTRLVELPMELARSAL